MWVRVAFCFVVLVFGGGSSRVPEFGVRRRFEDDDEH